MCGIVGCLNFDRNEPVAREAIEQMCDRIVHRGPDDAGFYICGHIGLGMGLLSIIDVAGGRQPITNEDETAWIVYNREIYNHEEFRYSLQPLVTDLVPSPICSSAWESSRF